MEKITSFMCFKIGEKENEKSPDYRLSAKVGEAWVDIGAGWIKEGRGGKFISFQLKSVYKDKSGFHLVEEKGEGAPKVEYPEEKIDLDDIPF